MSNDQLDVAMRFRSHVPGLDGQERGRAVGEASMTSAEFVIGGQSFLECNGGPHLAFSDDVSLFVACEDHAEVDLSWNTLVTAGATSSR